MRSIHRRLGLGCAGQHFAGQAGWTHTGVNTARYHLPSPPQAFTGHEPPVHVAVQTMPGVHGAAAFLFLAASDGAAVSAIAVTATAPTSRIFAMDFMVRPPSCCENR